MEKKVKYMLKAIAKFLVFLVVVQFLLQMIFGFGLWTAIDIARGEELEDDPIEIEDWHDLDAVRDDLSADYVLMNDLTLHCDGYDEHVSNPEEGWEPIDDFLGVFDGDGYQIRDLVIERDEYEVGLFERVTGVVRNIEFKHAYVTGGSQAGVLAGTISHGTVRNTMSREGYVAGDTTGHVAGVVRGGATVEHAFTTGTQNVHDDGVAGGLVGEVREGAGLYPSFDQTYSTVDLYDYDEDDKVGGLIGHGEAHVENSYWNTEVSGVEESAGGVGRTTEEMTDVQGEEYESVYEGFDFEEKWFIGGTEDQEENPGYPFLTEFYHTNFRPYGYYDVGIDSATLEGELTYLEDAYLHASLYIEYRGEGYEEWVETDKMEVSQEKVFEQTVSGLEAGTEYEFRVKHGSGRRSGAMIFETVPEDPHVGEPESEPKHHYADMSAYLFDTGGHDEVEVYFEYRKRGAEEWEQTEKEVMTETGRYYETIHSLQYGTEYEYRGAVDHTHVVRETEYTDIETFRTDPYAATLHASSIYEEQAGLNLNLRNEDYEEVTIYFEWKRSYDSAWSSTTERTEHSGKFTQTITDLDPQTQYDFRAVVEWDGMRRNGQILSFETLAEGTDSLALTIDSEKGGDVISPGEGVFQYAEGEEVTIEADADEDYEFSHWSGDTENITDPFVQETTVEINEDTELTAHFEEEGDEVMPPGNNDDDNGDDGFFGGFDIDIPWWAIVLGVVILGIILLWRSEIEVI